MAEYQNKPGSFAPRGQKKRKINKDGVLTLCFIALIAIIVIVLIVFLVKAIVGQSGPTQTTPPTTDSTVDSSSSSPNSSSSSIGLIPSGYSTIDLKYSGIYSGNLILVDDVNAYKPVSENNIVSLYKQAGWGVSYRLRNSQIGLDADVIPAFSSMLSAMRTAFAGSLQAGDYFLIQSAAPTSNSTAVIDYNNENTAGYSFDIRVFLASKKTRKLNDAEQTWLAENCASYGFVLRYDEGKEDKTGVTADLYHFRYVGIPHSLYMKANNLCLEEYLDLVKNYSYASPLVISTGTSTYNVYYVKAVGSSTKAYIPSGSIYTISGNNTDGFIITVTK